MYDLEFSESGMTTWALLRQAWTLANKVSEMKLAKTSITPEKLSALWVCRNYPPPVIPAEISRLTTPVVIRCASPAARSTSTMRAS